MSDLVERLRNNSWNGRISAPFEEAAAEIERLTAENARLRKAREILRCLVQVRDDGANEDHPIAERWWIKARAVLKGDPI